jgi:bifunctional DNA-binding transcriptional regulator/antitoxin component of YhaV-PrlF toxin-antitoxin module
LSFVHNTVNLYQTADSKETMAMPKISAKRQITLPIEQCRQTGIEPGDDYQSYVADGHITIIKARPEAARGILRQLPGDASMTDEESLQSAIEP